MALSHKQMGNPAEVDVKSERPEVAPPFFKGSKRVSGFMDQRALVLEDLLKKK